MEEEAGEDNTKKEQDLEHSIIQVLAFIYILTIFSSFFPFGL